MEHFPRRTGRTSISAHAVVRVEPSPGGGVQVCELRSEVPLVLRRTGGERPPDTADTADTAGTAPPLLPTVTVHLVNAAAGPLAGDRLRLDVTVGPGVRLVLRSVAATVALPGRGDRPSHFEVNANVGPGGALSYLPEPTVAARGCRHRMRAAVQLAATAHLLWREEIVLGRFDEPSGSIWSSLSVGIGGSAGNDDAGRESRTHRPPTVGPPMTRPLFRQELDLGSDTPGLNGAAMLAGARAVGSLLIAGPGQEGLAIRPVVTETHAVLPLAGPGVLVSALAADTVALRRSLDDGHATVADQTGIGN